MRTAVHTLALLMCSAHALRTPHPLLSNARDLRAAAAPRTPNPLLNSEAARAYRAAAGREFACFAPRIKAPLLKDSNKTEDMAAGKALLKKMDSASQSPADMTPVARRGYVRSVYDGRAFQVCELFGAAHQAGAVTLAPGARVASLGGGPGCCMLGYFVFESISLSGGGNGAETPRRWIFDYAPSWADDVSALADALEEPIPFGACDLSQELNAPENAGVRALAPTLDVVLLSRTLSEVPASGWAPFVRELWAALNEGAVLFVKDEEHVEAEAVRLLEADAWSVPGVRGTFLRK